MRYLAGVSRTARLSDGLPAPLAVDDPVPRLAVAFCVGLVLAASWPALARWGGAVVTAGVSLGWLPRRHGWVLAFLVLGVVRGLMVEASRPSEAMAALRGGEAVLRGVVIEPEVVGGGRARFVLAVRQAAHGQNLATVRARVLVVFPVAEGASAPVHWGQEVVVAGRVEAPATRPDFDQAAWLARRDIFEIVRLRSAGQVTACGDGQLVLPVRLAARLRKGMEQVLEGLLPTLPAALVKGVLLAESRGVPADVAQAFRHTGTFHVLVTAGIHVSFAAHAWIAALGALGCGGARASLAAVPVIALYALVSGASPSIVRAALMGALALAALAAGRLIDGRRSLALAALVMLAWNPRLTGDPGFQMSVACVTGILHLAPRISDALERLPAPLRRPLAVTLAVQIMMAPLSALYFGEVSLAGALANLVVVPLCEGLLALGFALSLVGGVAWAVSPLLGPWAAAAVLTLLGRPLAWAVCLDTTAVVAVVRRFASVPLCVVQVSPPDGREIVLWYVAVGLVVHAARARRHVPSETSGLAGGQTENERDANAHDPRDEPL